MPPLPPAANTLRVTLKGSLFSDADVVNRLYLGYSGTAPTNANLNTFSTAVATAWNSDLAGLFHSNYTLLEVETIDLTSATGAVGAWTGSHAGSRAGTSPPGGAAVLVNFKIARRYRGGHPRVYLAAGVQNDIASPQQWASSFTTAVLSGWNSFITALLAAPWSGGTISAQVNVSMYQGFNNVTYPSGRTYPRSRARATAQVDPVIATSVNPNFASQRRRNQTP